MRFFRLSRWCLALAFLLAIGAATRIDGTASAQSVAQAGRAAPVQGQTSAMAERDLTVANRGKRTVNELYVSPSTADDWGEDRLGDDTLDPGKTFRVRLGRSRDCEFDVQVVYDDASHEEQRKVNVCRARQIAFDGSTATPAPASAARNEHPLTLINHDTRPIQQAFISPADSGDWGDDRLRDESISVGDQKRLNYSGDCVADLRVVFDNRAAEERRGLDLCDSAVLTIEPGWTTADMAPARPAPAIQTPSPAATRVAVKNQSGHDVAEFYLYPEGAADRGPDRLGAREIKAGDSFVFPLDRGASCRFAARVVFTGTTPDATLGGLDLCASSEIILKP